MIKSYKEYIELYNFWKNYWWKINYIRKIGDLIRDKKGDEKAEEIWDLEQEIIDLINKNLEKAILIKAKTFNF